MINVYTEEKAKGMRCPTPLLPTKSLECEGSECMAWRFVETFCNETLKSTYIAGYCGLAGKP